LQARQNTLQPDRNVGLAMAILTVKTLKKNSFEVLWVTQQLLDKAHAGQADEEIASEMLCDNASQKSMFLGEGASNSGKRTQNTS
jgi:hypothetical protein